jgi:23S rRNA (pseudouridine1915-N3)-methyltransferase
VKIWVKAVAARGRESALEAAAALYADRLGKYTPMEAANYRSESLLLDSIERQRGRMAPWVVLLDGRGKAFTSDGLAVRIGQERDGGRQEIVFAIGPADGWSADALKRADLLLSLGPMTLPHELARVVLLEQLYRAFTIIAGHPYHCGH